MFKMCTIHKNVFPECIINETNSILIFLTTVISTAVNYCISNKKLLKNHHTKPRRMSLNEFKHEIDLIEVLEKFEKYLSKL